MNEAKYLCAEIQNSYLFKLVGTLRYDKCAAFKDYIYKVFPYKNFNSVLVDLSDVAVIDSTNLGLLAKIAEYTLEKADDKPISITNGNVHKILLSMNFDQIFEIVSDKDVSKIEFNEIQKREIEDDREMNKILLEAHKNLQRIDDENVSKFSDVVDLLEKSIKKEDHKENR